MCIRDRLDSVRPAALQQHITREEWDAFGDDIREAFAGAVMHNTIASCLRIVAPVTILVLLGTTLWIRDFTILLFGIPASAIVFLLLEFSLCFKRHCCFLGLETEANIAHILQSYSKLGSLTFHLLQDGSGSVRAHLENNQGLTRRIPVDYIVEVSVGPSYLELPDTADGLKLKLEQLERAKGMLTKEEYEKKRQSILDRV